MADPVPTADPDPTDPPPEPIPDEKPDDPAAMAEALKKANAEAKKFRLEAKAHAAELDKLRAAAMSDQDKAVAEAKAEGRTEALREAGTRIVEATIRAGAAGRSVDVDALLEAVNPAKFLAEDGSVDTAALTAWLNKVAPAAKPVPKVPTGPRGNPPDGKPSMSDALRALRRG